MAVQHLAGAPSVGLWLAVLSAASFGLSGPFAKGLLEAGWSPGAAVAARVAGGALLLAVPALVALRGRWGAVRENLGLVVSYGLLAVAGCQVAYFTAVTTLSVGVALLLEYLAPLLVVAWAWGRHGQRPRAGTVAGAALAVVGLVLVLDLTGGARVDPVGVLWGLLAACGLAAYFVLSGRPAPGLPPLALAAGGMAVGTVVLLLAGLVGVLPLTVGDAEVVFAGRQVHALVPLGGLMVVSAGLAYATGIAATRRLGARLASFVGLTEVLFAVAAAWLVLGELPRPVQLVGGVLILAGVVAVHADGPVTPDPAPAPAAEAPVPTA